MLAYRAAPFAPAFSRRLVPAMGQETPKAEISPGTVRTVITAAYVMELAVYGAAAWVGIWAGQKGTGLLSAAGWAIGILSGVRGLFSAAEFVTYAARGMPLPEGTAQARGPMA